MSINKVIISGNLTRDPELRSTPSGLSVLSFGVAVNDRRRNAQGEWEDVPNFVDCTLFGRRADALNHILTKGSKVAIEGKLRWHQWETNDGQKRSKLEVVVDEVEIMTARGDGAPRSMSQGYGNDSYSQPQYAPAPSVAVESVYDDEDIPF